MSKSLTYSMNLRFARSHRQKEEALCHTLNYTLFSHHSLTVPSLAACTIHATLHSHSKCTVTYNCRVSAALFAVIPPTVTYMEVGCILTLVEEMIVRLFIFTVIVTMTITINGKSYTNVTANSPPYISTFSHDKLRSDAMLPQCDEFNRLHRDRTKQDIEILYRFNKDRVISGKICPQSQMIVLPESMSLIVSGVCIIKNTMHIIDYSKNLNTPSCTNHSLPGIPIVKAKDKYKFELFQPFPQIGEPALICSLHRKRCR